MTQSHYALRNFTDGDPNFRDAQALLATRADGRAIVFIHGYGGDPLRTWSQFDQLLPLSSCGAAADIVFFGYDGLRADMVASSAIFRSFLQRLFQDGYKIVNHCLPAPAARPQNFEYKQLTIVAHSLGAVTARRALLDATKCNAPWVGNVNLVLYAPAHMGARVTDLALEVAGSMSFLRFFGAGARFQSPLIDQLKSGSKHLTDLLKETHFYTKQGRNKHLLAKLVVIAEYEKIVDNSAFANDPAPVTIRDTTHTSICKPSRSFRQPLELIEQYFIGATN